MKKGLAWYLGFLGFLGFTGFSYFATHNPVDLCGFGYFAFFGYFLVAKLKVSIPDERYLENTTQAKAFVGSLATLELSILFVLSALLPRLQHLLIFGITLCFVSLIIAYAVKLYQLEEM